MNNIASRCSTFVTRHIISKSYTGNIDILRRLACVIYSCFADKARVQMRSKWGIVRVCFCLDLVQNVLY